MLLTKDGLKRSDDFYGSRLNFFQFTAIGEIYSLPVYLKFSSRLTFLLQLTAKFLAVLQPTVTHLNRQGTLLPFLSLCCIT